MTKKHFGSHDDIELLLSLLLATQLRLP